MTTSPLAIDGGTPVRSEPLPIFRLSLTDAERAAVLAVVSGGQISRGPLRDELAAGLCDYTGAERAVVCSSGTAALHMAVAALDLEPGAEVIVPSLSFVATAFAAEYCGLTPVFAEVDATTGNIDVEDAARRVTDRTRAIIPVHFAGRPADTEALYSLARDRGLAVIEDAAHAAGAVRGDGAKIGAGATGGGFPHAVCFSFFATKNMTSAEGGAVTTDDAGFAERMERIRAHGISHLEDAPSASGFYDVTRIGYNLHLSDVNIALGIEQLKRLDEMNERRRHLATLLADALADLHGVGLPEITPGHAFHLFNIRLELDRLTVNRDRVVEALLAEGIGVGLYYRPIHLFSYYREKGHTEGELPVTEALSASTVTLPLYPAMRDADVDDVGEAIRKVIAYYTG